ncbi:MAG: cobyrinic acid a,c-diamide synthase [Candidatus Nanopelagicales bacterium]
MTRRATLPGADELFRRTGDAEPAAPAAAPAPAPVAAPAAAPAAATALADAPVVDDVVEPATAEPVRATRTTSRRRPKAGDRRPTGRERHEEKITVYVSPEELVDLEQAKLALRAQHGLAVDRGRIVREALAVVIADLEAKGEDSILVRRLRGL